MKRKWILPVLIGVIILGAAGYWGYDQFRTNQQLEVYLGNKYQQAFYEMVDRVEQLQVLLGKSLVSTSPRQNIMILNDVWRQADIAQQELTQLPLSAETVYKTAKFLSQTGDFAHVMARNNAEGRVLTAEQRNQLNQLRQHASEINRTLHDLESQVFAGKINWIQLTKGAGRRINQDTGESPVDSGFEDVQSEVEKLPSLIYDGPFSDQVANAKPRGLTGANITKDQARDRARKVLNFNEKDQELDISDGTSVNGKIPAYNFQVKNNQEGGEYSINITKKGGHLSYLLNNRSIASAKIQTEEAVQKARDFLAKNGYPNMEPTYSEVNENAAYISFAYKSNDILYYPDIINVQVALDNGQVTGCQALNYLMSHRQRQLEKPEISTEEAETLAEKTLDQIEETRLAVIPQAGLNEALTYEVRGSTGDETYLIYINASTGDEEQILRVVKGEQGTFAL